MVDRREGEDPTVEAVGSSAAASLGARTAVTGDAAATAPRDGGAGFRRVARRVLGIPEAGLVIAIFVTFGAFTLINSGFASGPNLQSLFLSMAYTGIIAVGEGLVMITGEFDLSVGSVAGMAAIIAGTLMTDGGLPVPVAIAVTIGIGAVVGLVNGVLTMKVRIPAFVVTLSMLFAAKGIGYVISQGDPVYPLPPDVGSLARTDIFGLPSSILVYLSIVVVVDLAMRHSTLGRVAYATGGNPLTAGLAGIRTDRVKIIAFTLCGSLASLGGILLMSRLQRADASIGIGWELNVIAGCVVGGVALGGGTGTILGTFLGLLLLQGVVQGLVIVGVDALLQPVAFGIVLILAAGFDLYRRRRFA